MERGHEFQGEWGRYRGGLEGGKGMGKCDLMIISNIIIFLILPV